MALIQAFMGLGLLVRIAASLGVIFAAYVAALLMMYLLARQAGRVPVAEALRFE